MSLSDIGSTRGDLLSPFALDFGSCPTLLKQSSLNAAMSNLTVQVTDYPVDDGPINGKRYVGHARWVRARCLWQSRFA
jgi:hypothetical protein